MRGGWQIIRVVECGSSGSWNNQIISRVFLVKRKKRVNFW